MPARLPGRSVASNASPSHAEIADLRPITAPEGEVRVERDDLFRLLVDSVQDYAIFMLDPQGCVATWNAGAQKIKGYTKNEILGRHFSVFYPAESVHRRWPQLELALALERGRFEDEGWRVRQDGTQFWANVVIAPIRDEAKRLRGFAKITRDLTARRQIEDLQRGERQVNEFLAMLSHELRNPLAPIQSALDVLERKPDDLDVARWGRAVIGRQVGQLSRLVDDLLDVSRITRGKIELKLETIDFRRAVEQVVDGARSIANARRQVIELTLPDVPMPIRADPVRLEQIIANLMSNACKFTPDAGGIRVLVATIGQIASVTVADDGVGISADLLPRIFDIFVQGERTLDRSSGGLGVGLTLSRRLAELMGGALTATSAGPGCGSEFTLAFPLVIPRRVPQRPARVAESEVQAKHYSVLVVDDNRDAADALAALLEILGHQPSVLHDGLEALESAVRNPPDFMLLDIGLPGMDGIEVARRLREMPELDRMRLIACTGYGREDDARRIEDAGFDRHLVKPVTVADLEQILSG
jgi:PAS domain S-box-containing protein